MNKTVANEVKNAYSDCHDHKAGARDLMFRASEAVSLQDAVAIMEKYVPGYNDFKPELLWQLPKDVKVMIAREGSVCVYLNAPETLPDIRDCISSMKVDECDYDTELGQIRLWWD